MEFEYTIKELMQIAIDEAYLGIKNKEGGPFGAVIALLNEEKTRGHLIAKAHNEVIKNNDPTCHGEMNVIRKACANLKTFDLKGYALFTTGVPCPMCFGAISWANISTVYFGCNLQDTEEIGFRDSAFFENLKKHKKYEDNFIELSREECLKLYEDYLKNNGKANY